ncbi:bifunctional phosphoribosyl-AMP cyclohydrolase/phosphoribosyl-ATP diphosphatase HisIE [Shewanella sp. FJAT-52076]|uniref:bifunctional phosphoribosyl-AMP cyclohydrolase/phosphoribosyl-ATP diphosphatase HisIE n=1 Tax=Shewanella sp. FJAT-52076 TaxID=2864202 RepID=UPI001C65B40B|nr:bifunctional phosphoribosyl-AMP cyclohydrolase/phosphoribosyl-ATP diphosphatase HisIE [Shewanella sp. FJAT-52076]QYJ73754.1 bifunctional phosphoribosyl-AMP cyclohydrolase/phosphoribosyl-ATP diphosphatase HisIE [Shewanella sp. FJAT-52076]
MADETLLNRLDWDKQDGLIPAIVQNHLSGKVLMQGYMDKAALEKTLQTGMVTFFSRSKQRLWTKGESSGHVLSLISIAADCDNDSLLVQVMPKGPTCHTGTESCWQDGSHSFIAGLESLIQGRKKACDAGEGGSSYTASLFASGTKRMAQKVGEEGLETALAAATHDKKELVDEASDLLFHLMVLLEDQGLSLADITENLYERHKARS